MMNNILILFLFTFFIGNNAYFNPHKDPEKCGRPVCNQIRKFNFTRDTNYQYKYNVDVKTLFDGSSKNQSTLFISALATFSFQTECEGKLLLEDVKLSNTPDSYDRDEDIDIISPPHAQSSNFDDDLGRYELRFAFADGAITEICPEIEEPTWVLNFKRGLLSIFQNTMQRFDMDHNATELDVNGVCNTAYVLNRAQDSSLIIDKFKDTDSCENRYKYHSVMQTSTYHFQSNKHQIPVMKSSSHCTMVIDHYIYTNIVCDERHMFQPFARNNSGATTLIRQQLVLLNESPTSPSDTDLVSTRKTLLYDHLPTPKPTSGELKHSRAMLKDMCTFNRGDIQIEFSNVYSKFIEYARLLPYTTLSMLYHRAFQICESGKKHILDALPFLGTDASVQLMRDIIIKEQLDSTTVKEWLFSFAFIPRPTSEMLEAMQPLLDLNNHQTVIPLSVGTMVHMFCRWSPDCHTNTAVESIVDKIEQNTIKLYQSRFTDRNSHDRLLINLKALSNIGIVQNEHFSSTLQHLIGNKDISMEIRVAAINVYRRQNCADNQSYFMRLFTDTNADTEIRIAAYLQAMRCPNYALLQRIRYALIAEEVNQVGSFVWTHLTNLLKSSVPSRVEIQGLLSDRDLGKKFSSDFRKYSHNFEGSVFFEQYNIGGNFEMNTIFSTKSYVPRSISLNLTADLFGESVNLFEINGRIEGLENYLESLFGPNRTYSAKNLKEKVMNSRLFKRSTDDNEVLKKQITSLPNINSDNFGKPKISIGTKIFGNDLVYSSFVGDTEINEAVQKLNPVHYLRRILSGQEISYNKAFVFLDTSYIVPTGSGLPVILNAAGTAALNLRMSGLLRSVDFLKTGQLDIQGYLQPSMAVDVIGTMAVDAYYASTGIKLKTNFYSSSNVQSDIKIRGPRLVSIQFKLPQKKTEIFGAQSELIVMKGDEEEYQSDITGDPIDKTVCSWPMLDRTIGLKMCAYYKFPNGTSVKNHTAPFLFHGPTKLRMYLEKADPTADIYLLQYRWDSTNVSHSVSLMFDTPGSRVNRMMLANATLNTAHQNLTVLLKSNEGLFSAVGNYRNTDSEKMIDLTLDVDGNKHFSGQMGYLKKPIKNGHKYYPTFLLSVNNDPIANLSGTLETITKKDVTQCEVNLTFETKKLKTRIDGYISKAETTFETNLRLIYQFEQKQEEMVKLDGKLKYNQKVLFTSLTGDLRLETTAYPNLNFISSLKFQKAAGHIECKVEINSGTKMQEEKNKLTLVTVFSCFKTHNGTTLNTYVAITKPTSQIDIKVQLQHRQEAANYDTRLLIRYADKREIIVQLYLSMPHKPLFEIDIAFNCTLPTFTPMIVEVQIKEKHKSLYNLNLKGVWFSGHRATAKGHYQDWSTPIKSEHIIKLHIESPSFTDLIADAQYYRDDNNFKINILVHHQSDMYSLLLKHVTNSPTDIVSYGEVRYKQQIYTATSTIDLKDKRQIILELHIDQIRDIYIVLKSINQEFHKQLAGEIKWDSNRDPSQKLGASVELFVHGSYNTSGNFVFNYPGRTINGNYAFALKSTQIRSLARFAWDPKHVIDFTFNTNFKHDNQMLLFVLQSELLTPFETWEKTSFNGAILHRNNLYRVNGSIYWHSDQFISTDLFTNYSITANHTDAEVKALLQSTVQDIPSIACQFKHYQDQQKLDQQLYLMYHPQQIISLNSTWIVTKDLLGSNYTGTMSLSSPFDGYKRGILQSKIRLTTTKIVLGFATLDLDSRHFTASCQGHLTKITDNLLMINITTPMERYKRITGRFGLNEQNRHLQAVIKYPVGAIGLEILLQIRALNNFNVLLDLATPLDFFSKLLIRAKLIEEEVDFRGGWNNILVGCSGVWHYRTKTNFEYAYKLYTPIEGIEENGIVAKLIYDTGLDMEVSIQLADSRLGLTINGQPKPQLKGFVLEPSTLILWEPRTKFGGQPEEPDSDEDIAQEEDDEEIATLNWSIQTEIDVAVYPTIKGVFEIDEIDTVYRILGTILLPYGPIHLRNEFNLEDYFRMNNRLLVSTPFPNFKQITSKMDFEITLKSAYLIGMDFNFKNYSEWISTGYEVSLITTRTDEDCEISVAHAHLHTPFKHLQRIDLNTRLEIDENHYRGNASFDSISTHININGTLEKDEGFLDTILLINLTSPFLQIQPTIFKFKKEFSEVENSIELGVDRVLNDNNPLRIELMWQKPTDNKLVLAKIKIATPSKVLENFHIFTLIDYNRTSQIGTAQFYIDYNNKILQLNGTLNDNIIKTDISTFIDDYKSLALVLRQTPDPIRTGFYQLIGQIILNKKKTMKIGGTYLVQNDALGYIRLQTENGITFEYKINPQTDGYQFFITMEDAQIHSNLNISAKIEFKHKLDWKFKLDTKSSNNKWNNLGIETEIMSPTPNNITVLVNTITRLPGLEEIQADFNLLLLPNNAGTGKLKYNLDRYKGDVGGRWQWMPSEKVQVKLLADYQIEDIMKNFEIDIYYINPNQNYQDLRAGGEFTVDRHNWTIGSNLEIKFISLYDVIGKFNLILPTPNTDKHTAKLIFKNLDESSNKHINGLIQYATLNTNINYAIGGTLDYINDNNATGQITVEWGPENTQRIKNAVDLTKTPQTGQFQIEYDLFTPLYSNQNTFSTQINYDGFNKYDYHNFTIFVYKPENRQIFNSKIHYKEFSNMAGLINTTTPFISFPYIGANFDMEANIRHLKRNIKAFWPNNTALFHSTYNYIMQSNHRGGKGLLLIDIPLTSRHNLTSDYEYHERPNNKNGFATVNYNNENILKGKYNCVSQLRAGFQKDVVHLEVENQIQPFGINYVHQIDTEAAIDGFAPTLDFKRAELFKLHNKTAFNVSGELSVRTTLTGEEYHLIAHHMNRTVKIDTDYDILDQQFLNKARFQLANDIWFAYDMNLLNKTFDFNSQSQQINVELAYPRRNVTVFGSYNVSVANLASELALTWDKQTVMKNVEAAFDWRQLSFTSNHQQAVFQLRHPSFEKNVTFLGEYQSDKVNLADINFEVEYSNDPNKKLQIKANMKDNCKNDNRNYTFMVHGTHPATSLDLMINGIIDYHSKYYHLYNEAQYKRSYLPLQMSHNSAKLDLIQNEIELERSSERDRTYLWLKSEGHYPIYSVNGSLVFGEDTDANMTFNLNLYEKQIRLEGNRTPDATESVHMWGEIPNARSAYFDFWRDYDDIRIYDVSYYLQLNHSRLITSKLLWRPEIKADLKDSLRQMSQKVYNSTIDNIEYWKNYLRSEFTEAIYDIWSNANTSIQGFLEDMNDLKVLEEDIDKFKLFLNESYENNEFFVRDLYGFVMYFIDELAIRDHIQSVPGIVNEIWGIMGESGKAMQKSIQWLIKTIKESYKKLIQFINDVMKGEALEQITKMLEYFIKKYDKFIKDLHVSIIKYMEKMWNDASKMIVNHWNRMLSTIEPTFLKFIHYTETVIWSASKEFLDFLYKRKHEIEESPYFIHFSNFTQDIDRFYKDMVQNSIITNIRKYSHIVWQFIKEKYFTMIPFGKELRNVLNEILTELNELKKLPSVQFLIVKYHEIYGHIVWIYDYFEIGERVQKIILILHSKITEITENALESDNRNREAKTKFIFDPETGIMELEQKLPMSWHAFNETPRFMEIPEIKMLIDVQNYLVMSNKSFWMLYYQYKPYLEPSMWVPPFDSYAMIIGPQHFITFDGQHYDFSGTCSYLLAHDFIDGNFSALISYETKDKIKKYKIDLLIDDVFIQVDLFADTIRLMKKGVNTKLPLQLKEVFIYREADLIFINSERGFTLKCNLKFDFCRFHLSGWYFGKTAGLWGTMNNEPYDDYLASTNRINRHVGRFAHSWALQPKKCRSTSNQAQLNSDRVNNKQLIELCESLFKSKISPLSRCFPIIDSQPFHDLCINYPGGDNRTTCTAVVAYMETCKQQRTPIRIPELCVTCDLYNGTDIPEGEFIKLEGNDVPRSADIVFIVEAKDCNANITTKRNINQLISLIQKELTNRNLTNNRYAVVVFGGPGIYNSPRSIIVNNQIFTSHQTIGQYFDQIPTGNGSSNDIFNAIIFAKNLIFRPGVSKSIVLLPCTNCQVDNMKLDYPVLLTLLRENDIILHILMNNDFIFQKSRINKIFFGMDSNTAYTKKDIKQLIGDSELRRQVKIPKVNLGHCASLALESNGSIFSAIKLENEQRNAVKKFATVLAKRVASTCQPNQCQMCECTANSDGISYTECLPCHYPSAINIDYAFNDDDSFSSFFNDRNDDDEESDDLDE